jgi:hypothetical protein
MACMAYEDVVQKARNALPVEAKFQLGFACLMDTNPTEKFHRQCALSREWNTAFLF